MTYFYYKTNTWGNSDPQVSEETRIKPGKHLSHKRKTGELYNYLMDYYQTECQRLKL